MSLEDELLENRRLHIQRLQKLVDRSEKWWRLWARGRFTRREVSEWEHTAGQVNNIDYRLKRLKWINEYLRQIQEEHEKKCCL